jgi:hypothetical protein
MSVGEGVRTWVWYTPGRAPTNPNNEPFLAYAARALLVIEGQVSLPHSTRRPGGS